MHSEISFLADALRISLQSQQDTQKMVDGVSLPCIFFLFLVDFPCARFQEGQPGSRVSRGTQLYFFACARSSVISDDDCSVLLYQVFFSPLLRSGPHEKTFRYRTFLCLKISTWNPAIITPITLNSQARTGTGEYYFPCSTDLEQDWQPYPVDPYSAICDDHTYIHTYCTRPV